MSIIDPTTDIGKLRLRVGDWQDIPILPDSVYTSALSDCSNNLPRSAILCAQYILAILSFQTHQRLATIEIYGNQIFAQYLQFLQTTVLNPNLMQIAPIPYGGADVANGVEHPLLKFKEDWDKNYVSGTQSEQMAITAIGGSNANPFGF